MALRCDVCNGCGKCFGSWQNRVAILTQGTFPVLPVGKYLVVTDIGTTTIAMVLLNDRGLVVAEEKQVNPQGQYGADVLSRITAAKDGAAALQMKNMVEEVLKKGMERFRRETGVSPELQVIAANTTMVYLLLGHDPRELGEAPFTARHLEASEREIAGVKTWILPGFSAFVGGDLFAGMVSSSMGEGENVKLLIDLGTNGEMLLGNKNRIWGCSTAAGPAFEGGPNKGVWGADMVSLLASLRAGGFVDETGLLRDDYFDSGVRISDVLVTQESIRAIQLAKGAIAAGIRILLNAAGLEAKDVSEVVLAGGLGYYLSPEDAGAIGLLPLELVEKAVSGGNTALQGAAKVGGQILQGKSRGEMPPVEILNLAEQADFQEIYFSSMNLEPWRLNPDGLSQSL